MIPAIGSPVEGSFPVFFQGAEPTQEVDYEASAA